MEQGLLLLISADRAEAVVQAANSLSQTSPQVANAAQYTTALIAAGGALGGVLVKDLFLKLFHDQRAKKENLRAVYARYGDPLCTATVSLMWRLHETLEQPGRGSYLKLVGIPSDTNKYSTFGAYKKLSTLYRLAVLLGWITACRREFSYLRVADSGALEPIQSAIAKFESALADGPIVANERLMKLCTLWGIGNSLDKAMCPSIAVDLEVAVDEYFQELGIDELKLLTDDQQSALVSRAAYVVTQRLGTKEIPSPILSESCARAIQILDIKEAWIYRDWQSAIGDLMLRGIDRGERRFEVIGFSEFESFCTQGSDEQKKWIARLSAVFDGIDLSKKDPYDHRPTQLCDVLAATANLVLVLTNDSIVESVSEQSRNLAARIVGGDGCTGVGKADP